MLIYLSLLVWSVNSESDLSCFTTDGRPVRCMPDFMNIAFGAQVFASNTCGNPPTEFCVQQEIGLPPQENNCYKCDRDETESRHPAEYLTDRNEDDNSTWWQSQTLYDTDINNMTLHLPFNKSFDIAYVKIEFQSPRPESMVIEKSLDYGRSWEVYQYFSSSCYKTFDKRTDEAIYVWDETKAICTRKYSEISPLQGGIVNFSPLKGRPSSKDLYNSPRLLKWSRATDIRIRLIRLNTFGDQFFSDQKNEVLKTYFYAISDLSVGGRCTCHGHGGSCTREACKCEHNTAGRNCERCADMFNDLPWKMSTTDEPFQCKSCQCNDLANRCVFDKTLFDTSNGVSGGVCVGCRSNTAGQHCEKCAHGYYPNLPVGHADRCKPCQCNEFGSIGDGDCVKKIDVGRGLTFGDCQCKAHVQGIACDTCQDGYFGLQEGCLRCECDPVGTLGDIKLCNKADGQCKCKENIMGRECNKCMDGYYNYLLGCRKCNCNKAGSSSKTCHQETGQCKCRKGMQGLDCRETEPGTFKPDVGTITFGPDMPDRGVVKPKKDGDEEPGTGPTSDDDGLDNLTFDGLKDKDDYIEINFTPPKDGLFDIYVKYTSGQKINDVRFDVTSTTLRHDISQCNAKMIWLDNLPATGYAVHELDGACLVKGVDYILTVSLNYPINSLLIIHAAVLMPQPEQAVIDSLIEELQEVEWGGESNDTQGAWDYCQEKIAMYSALELKEKHPGCSAISDIIISDLSNGSLSCDCDSVGANSPDTCEKIGGQCACKPHITGTKCTQCVPGYHSLSTTGCDKCQCNEIGSENLLCDWVTGQCTCKQGVTGLLCDQCNEGQFSFASGTGCRECLCSESSISPQCDQYGQCTCAPGIGGLRCDRCLDGYYQYSNSGCKVCNCNSVGGSKVCDKDTGRCRCKDNVVGETCLSCQDNAFSLQKSNPKGCQLCFCYNHTSQCSALTTYRPALINTDFDLSSDLWTARESESSTVVPTNWSPIMQYLELQGTTQAFSYCLVAPPKYTGNQINSFLTKLTFTINAFGTKSSVSEVFIRSYPYTLSLIPRVSPGEEFSVLLHHSKDWLLSRDGYSEPLTSHLFKSVLGDVRIIELCGTVYPEESLVLDKFSLGSAVLKTARTDVTAYNVELCQCPEGYSGSSCDLCSVGYKRSDPSLGKMSPCVKCECNGYSKTCHSYTGVCDSCSHSTGGNHCAQCLDGYYGEPGFGNPSSCKRCACPHPNRSFSNTCKLIEGGVVCTNCTKGHTGNKCDECSDGYFGEPKYNNPNQYCTKCTCNGNIDNSSDGNCDSSTGQCLKCINNTSGRYCEQCSYGYHGDAVDAKNCTKCLCNAEGSNYQYLCDSTSGQCECKSNVIGLQCDRCSLNYYGISSSDGCTECKCDVLGALDLRCNYEGICECRDGYHGNKCNECSENFYYHTTLGCTACNCDDEGSQSSQCDNNGQCHCLGAVQGKQCDYCPVNMFNTSAGCTNCPDCYSLVEREVNELKNKLKELETLMKGIDTPTIEASPEFRRSISEVRRKIGDTLAKANETSQLAQTLKESGLKIEELIRGLKEELKAVEKIKRVVNSTIDGARYKLQDAINTIQDIDHMLEGSVYMLLREGNNALKKAQKNMAALSAENRQMQEMASQARKIALLQEKEAAEVTSAAKEAAELSASALNTARRAKDTLKNTQNQLDSLRSDIGELKEEYELAKSAANESISRAQSTLQGAQQLRDSACAKDSLTDLAQLSGEIEELGKAASNALEGAKTLKDKAIEVQNRSQTTTATATLTKGRSADSELAQLESQARLVYNASVSAVNECTSLISDAKKLLKFLQNYENEVAKAKAKAQEAIANLDDIETSLTVVEDKVESANAKIGEGDKDMTLILDNVVNAKAVLQNSLQAAKSVASQVSALLSDSNAARQDALQLKKDVVATRVELARLRGLAQNGTEELKMSLEEAENSKAKADKLGSTLAVGETRLKNLKVKLSKVDTIDADKLNELIDRLQESENEVNASGIDDQISEMRSVADNQEDQITMYRARIEAMKEEINTLSVIDKQIPDTTTCYNPVS